jgi:hypothetical protein
MENSRYTWYRFRAHPAFKCNEICCFENSKDNLGNVDVNRQIETFSTTEVDSYCSFIYGGSRQYGWFAYAGLWVQFTASAACL